MMLWICFQHCVTTFLTNLINAELIFSDIHQHLELLSEHFTKYILKETYDNFDWILNPFLLQKLIFQDARIRVVI